MPMDNTRDLFTHDLASIYDAEQRLAHVLLVFADEVKDEQISGAFTAHQRETLGQVSRLEQCFRLLGQQPPLVVNLPMQALILEHGAFLAMRPSPALLTLFDLGAAAKTEHLEIAAYRGLITQARALHEDDVVTLLSDTLRQEERTAVIVESFVHRVLGVSMASVGTELGVPTKERRPFTDAEVGGLTTVESVNALPSDIAPPPRPDVARPRDRAEAEEDARRR